MRYLSAILIMLSFFSCTNQNSDLPSIEVDASVVTHTMAGGLGASWHAISKDLPLNNEKYKIPVREENPRGSAWGGNPPVTDTAAWEQIKKYASWLGLDFVRVELSQRMYEPERKQYDWDNEEMQALYNILDWCQENDADVFLQQMWHYTEWNAFPGIHPLLSAPKNLDDFAEGIASMVEYLINEKGYTCIKYFCMINEPPGGPGFGYWWEYGDAEGSINDAWKRLHEEFAKRNISIPLAGPDWATFPALQEKPELNKQIWEIEKYFGAIDVHSYRGITPEREAKLKNWTTWAHSIGKPFFLTELGNMNLGWGGTDPGQKSWNAAISISSDILRGIRANTDAFNRWSFTNRGDLDGQWQLIHTFDRDTKTYLSEVKPEPEAFYGFGMISRFFPKHASIVDSKWSLPDSLMISGALMSQDGNLSIFIVNFQETETEVVLKVAGSPKEKLHVYQATQEAVNRPGFRLDPLLSFNPKKGKRILLPGRSITTVSSYNLKFEDTGVFK
jgi:hypothetical protein